MSHQSQGRRLAVGPRHRPDPLAAVPKERPGPSGDQEQPRGAQTRVLPALRHRPGAGATQRLWQLVALRLNFFTPTKKPVGYSTTANGRRKRVYDKPATPWQRLQASGVLDTQHLANVAARIEGINPADLTRHQRDPNAATGPGQGQDRGPRRHPSHRSRSIESVNQPTGQGEVTQAPTRSPSVRHHPLLRAHFYVRHLGSRRSRVFGAVLAVRLRGHLRTTR